MIDYEVIDKKHSDFEDGRLVKLEHEVEIFGNAHQNVVLARGSGFFGPSVGVFDTEGDLLVEGSDEETTLLKLARYSDNLEVSINSI